MPGKQQNNDLTLGAVGYFYQFSGLHALLIGLLPFFIPVLLWQQKQSLPDICLFISASAIGFLFTLKFWETLRAHSRWELLIRLSFMVELFLVAVLLNLQDHIAYLLLVAFLNGAYNCLYWTTQRVLFTRISTSKNTGKTFGNFQILVTVLLKMGILASGFLLEASNTTALFLFSGSLSLAALIWFQRQRFPQQVSQVFITKEPINLPSILKFRDNRGSMITFSIDGIFLFLESYFWVLSLYFIGQNSFSRLSLIVVGLALVLSLVFYLIKNRIDRANQARVFRAAIYLYLISWLLRAILDTNSSDLLNYSLVIVIAFLTVFFRLAFNKRFFDIASAEDRNPTHHGYHYLLVKSFYSQSGIAIFFAIMALLTTLLAYHPISSQIIMQWMYYLAMPLSLVYFIYGGATDNNSKSTIMTSSGSAHKPQYQKISG